VTGFDPLLNQPISPTTDLLLRSCNGRGSGDMHGHLPKPLHGGASSSARWVSSWSAVKRASPGPRIVRRPTAGRSRGRIVRLRTRRPPESPRFRSAARLHVPIRDGGGGHFCRFPNTLRSRRGIR